MKTALTSKLSLKVYAVIFCLMALALSSCEDNELSQLLEDESIEDPDEDPDSQEEGTADAVTYNNTVKAILDNACVQCHNATNANGGVRLHNYANARAVADSGRMIARMTSSSSPMPPSGNLPDPIIQDILDWIEDGLLEN
ncbi:MAG: c-type cytochrome domain-containing protein [Dokdonia sp.]|jgi:mono/diheme cytochrome c family protein|nr:hypothetical protein [Cytophagaceae bacterium]